MLNLELIFRAFNIFLLIIYLVTESLLADNECPHKVKSDLTTHGFHCTFAFKRIDAKIAWPFLS